MNLAKVAHSFFLTAKDVKEDWVATSFSTTEGTEYTEELGVLLLGICFLSEVVESIMRGGDRGLFLRATQAVACCGLIRFS